MIYIFDNGQSYSDHEIFFLKSNLPKETVVEIVNKIYYSSDCYLIAVVNLVEWYKGKVPTLKEWVKFWGSDNRYNIETLKLFGQALEEPE